MASAKKRVGEWRLVRSEPGSYEYETTRGPMTYRVSIFDDAGRWRLMAGGFKNDSSARHVPEADSIERYGGAMHVADDFEDAKNKAYRFMRKMPAGMVGYNGLLDTASRAGWD